MTNEYRQDYVDNALFNLAELRLVAGRVNTVCGIIERPDLSAFVGVLNEITYLIERKLREV